MPVPQERKVTCYPPMPLVEQLQGYAALNEESESTVVTQALKEFFDKLPADRKLQIINAAKELKLQGKTVSKNSY